MEHIIGLFEEEDGSVEIIEEGEWEQNHKNQFCSTIVRYEGRYYEIFQSRTGSYYSDWNYDKSSICEVIPKEVTKIIWVNA